MLGGREDRQRRAFIYRLYVSYKVFDSRVTERQINTVIDQLNEGSPAHRERVLRGRPGPQCRRPLAKLLCQFGSRSCRREFEIFAANDTKQVRIEIGLDSRQTCTLRDVDILARIADARTQCPNIQAQFDGKLSDSNVDDSMLRMAIFSPVVMGHDAPNIGSEIRPKMRLDCLEVNDRRAFARSVKISAYTSSSIVPQAGVQRPA